MIWTNDLHICPEDRLTLLTFATAQAIRNIFAALLNGAALFPLDVREQGVTHLAKWLIHEEITIYMSGSPLFRHFAESLTRVEKFPKLRLIRLGSESVSIRHVELYQRYFSPDCIFANALSNTESGTIRKYFICKEAWITGSVVPVGYEVDDKEILLLDGDRKVGFNEVGEIVVKSRYLSPGYWQRPDLTKAAFVPSPDGGDERIYRTGDLGWLLPDDCLVRLGRKDSQVKIRGYRVETVEVERALLELDIFREAAVIAQEDQSGGRRLVAYVVPKRNPAPTVNALRRDLAKRLPDYMIPSIFMVLDTLPLAPNGKIDRRALPAPPSVRPELDTPFATPRTPVEELLAGIWANVLELDQIGIHDNFFGLGGDSLLASQVVSRVSDAFQVQLTVRSLFESPTVADMAAVIAENQGKKAGQ